MKVVTAEQMRQIDQATAAAGLTTSILMENAGRAVANESKKMFGMVMGKHILILIGPGNNGGDGLVAGRYLHDMGAEVYLYLCGKRPAGDPNYMLAKSKNIACISPSEDPGFSSLEKLYSSVDVVIDAIFGTGKSRKLDGIYKQALDKLNSVTEKKSGLFTIAIDLPSGLDANTGTVDPSCPRVNATITLGYPKPGLYSYPGAEKAGTVIIADIGIPAALASGINTELVSPGWVKSILPPRPLNANKGSFGKVMVAAGSVNYVGAAYLACMGAARAGAGLVTLAAAYSLQCILATKLAEVTYVPLPEESPCNVSSTAAAALIPNLLNYDVLLIGCGLGQSAATIEFIKSTLFSPVGNLPLKLVIDADAINTLAKVPEWWKKLNQDAILTPHPGEMSRLAGMPLDKVQENRFGIVREKAMEWGKTLVLKGAYTLIAAPDGRIKISTIANPGLASAGTGDVLSGVIAGLVAQGMPLFEAASCGVFLHGQAGNLACHDMGDAGTLASDLLPLLPRIIRNIKGREQ